MSRFRHGHVRLAWAPRELTGGVAGSGRFFEDFCQWQRIQEYQDVIFHSRLGPAVSLQTAGRTIASHRQPLTARACPVRPRH